jgi:hypothetical protein
LGLVGRESCAKTAKRSKGVHGLVAGDDWRKASCARGSFGRVLPEEVCGCVGRPALAPLAAFLGEGGLGIGSFRLQK